MNQAISTACPVVLSVAGFDPSGGAGIVADLKTFAAHNCYGVAAITALTVQNTQGVASVHPVEPLVLRESILSLLSDGRVKALKIGMLCNTAIAEVLREILESNPDLPAVLDPVLRSSNNFDLLDAAGLDYIRRQLLSRVAVVTPNLAEAAALAEMPVDNLESMKAAARKLGDLGARAVVVTGGHLEKAVERFLRWNDDGIIRRRPHQAGQHTRNGLHFFLCRGRPTRLGAPFARCGGARQGLCCGSHPPSLPCGPRPHSPEPSLSHE